MQKLRQASFLLSFLPICFVFAMDQASCDWVQDALSRQQAGAWAVPDKSGKTVIVEGEMISKNLQMEEFQMIFASNRIIVAGDYLEDLAAFYADAMQEVEIDLAKTYSGAWLSNKVEMLYYWKSSRDILYDLYVKKISEILTQESIEPVYLFKVNELQEDGGKLLLGSVMFGIKQDYAYGNIEMFNFVIKPEAQGRGLDRILAGAVFKLLPQTKRIFLDVNCNDDKAINVYESMGFAICAELWGHRIYEYLVSNEYLYECAKECRKDFLLLRQDVAAMFREIRD